MKVFCWDLNGTLEEGSEIALTEAINESLAKRGIKRMVSTEDVFRFFGGDADKLAREVSSVTIPREELEELTFTKAEKYVKPTEGAEEALSEVRRRGDMNVVVSGSGARMVKRYLEVTRLMPYVNGYIGIDTFQIMYSKMGIAAEIRGVYVEKTKALLQFADHSYVDRVVMVGDSTIDMRVACATNTLLHQDGKRRNVRPVLFRAPGRKERILTSLGERLYDEVLRYVIGYKEAKTLREAIEMGYAEGGMSYIRKHPLSTATAIVAGIVGASSGIYFAMGNSYWYIPLLAFPILPPIGIINWRLENRIELLKEKPVSLKES